MPCRFHANRCAASEEFATSTAWTPLAYSWPMRWNTRSAPVRSTRTSMPENFALKVSAIFSATARSIAVYQTTLPSFFAASISCGVIASAGGAAARAASANTVPSASAVEPFRTSRLEISRCFIASFLSVLLSAERAAAFRRQRQPDFGTPSDRGFGGCHDDAQGGAIRCLDHVVAVGAEKHLPRHGGLDGVVRRRRGLGRELDVVLADRDGGILTRIELGADHLQHGACEGDMVFVAGDTLDHIAGADEAGDEFRLWPVVDILGGAELVDLAGIHHRDQIGDGHRLGLVVGDVNRGVAVFVVQPADLKPH